MVSLHYLIMICFYSLNFPRSIIWNRQLDGALNRVPADFYNKVWQILERTPAGLKVAGYLLPQVIQQTDRWKGNLIWSYKPGNPKVV